MTSYSSQGAPDYNLSGVLHFLQSEWRRYEHDRNTWAIERAELRARIALLEGERRSVENLKTDLLRRIKMLELALRQERTKLTPRATTPTNNVVKLPVGVKDAKGRAKSREYLQQCLQEIAYLTSNATLNPITQPSDPTNPDSASQPPRPQFHVLSSVAPAHEEKVAPTQPTESNAEAAISALTKDTELLHPTVDPPPPASDPSDDVMPVSNTQENLAVQQPDKVPDVQLWHPHGSFSSHLDAVRALVYDGSGEGLFTASDDCTIKYWRMLPTAVSQDDQSKPVAELLTTLRGHQAAEAVWGLTLFPSNGQEDMLLVSVSASGKIQLWKTREKEALPVLSWDYFGTEPAPEAEKECKTLPSIPVPTSVTNLADGKEQMAFQPPSDSQAQANMVVGHPTLPLIAAAHEDHYIHVYDIRANAYAPDFLDMRSNSVSGSPATLPMNPTIRFGNNLPAAIAGDTDIIPTAIVIKNIPFNIKREQLLHVIRDLGIPVPYAFNYHFDQGIFRGLAFANFHSPAEANEVVAALNGLEVSGRKLRVEYKKVLQAGEKERIEKEKALKRMQFPSFPDKERKKEKSPTTEHPTLHVQNAPMRGSSPVFGANAPQRSSDPVAGFTLPRIPLQDSGDPALDLNDGSTLEIYSRVLIFKDDRMRDELSFSKSLTPEERRVVHLVSEKLGLYHYTLGTGDDCYVLVTKTNMPHLNVPDLVTPQNAFSKLKPTHATIHNDLLTKNLCRI
ncbi:Peptidyl-prolyl cis-trans isomerase pin4 [Malassezia equina]|uniref:Peptidyl-prolyl cis-trans isomerase pin4 n=1 Tax=Malassezia equina TaxID=1381935 RepID=A0AAF0IYV5_9BASI|nr:Peptidyl-prolyl cis-trans isomerase pin4 [Malassezia equina]